MQKWRVLYVASVNIKWSRHSLQNSCSEMKQRAAAPLPASEAFERSEKVPTQKRIARRGGVIHERQGVGTAQMPSIKRD